MAQHSPTLGKINFRDPTGKVTWPCILIAGEEGVGKTWKAYELSKSDKIGWAFAIDLGEGSADEYKEVGDYKVVHPADESRGWSFAELYEQVAAIREFAREELAAGRPPVLLSLDAISDEWAILREAMNNRVKGSAGNQRKLRQDPMAELDVPFHIRNETNAKHRRLMTLLMTFPGIVVLIARAKEVTPFENGAPVANAPKEWKPEGHNQLMSNASVVIRMDSGKPAEVVKARSFYYGVRPSDPNRVLPDDWDLERFIFDALKVDPATAQVRDLRDLADEGDDSLYIGNPALAAQNIADTAASVLDVDTMAELRAKAADHRLLGQTVEYQGASGLLGNLLNTLTARLDQAAAAARDQQQAQVAQQPTAPVQPVQPVQPPAPQAPVELNPQPLVEVEARSPAAPPAPAPVPQAAEPVAQAAAPTPAPVAVAVAPRPTFAPVPESETRAEKMRRFAMDELAYQAHALGVDPGAYAATVDPDQPIEKVKASGLQRFLTSQRETVVTALRQQGRATEAQAIEGIGIAFPVNLAQVLESTF